MATNKNPICANNSKAIEEMKLAGARLDEAFRKASSPDADYSSLVKLLVSFGEAHQTMRRVMMAPEVEKSDGSQHIDRDSVINKFALQKGEAETLAMNGIRRAEADERNEQDQIGKSGFRRLLSYLAVHENGKFNGCGTFFAYIGGLILFAMMGVSGWTLFWFAFVVPLAAGFIAKYMDVEFAQVRKAAGVRLAQAKESILTTRNATISKLETQRDLDLRRIEGELTDRLNRLKEVVAKFDQLLIGRAQQAQAIFSKWEQQYVGLVAVAINGGGEPSPPKMLHLGRLSIVV